MIPNVERWHFITWKKLSVLLRGIMPNNSGNFYCLNFHSFRKKMLIHVKKYVKIFFFVMLQCFLKTLRYSLISNDNSEKSSTTKVGEHIASDFPVSTISSVKDKIKHDVQRGRDSMKNLCLCLNQHTRKIIIKNEVINKQTAGIL